MSCGPCHARTFLHAQAAHSTSRWGRLSSGSRLTGQACQSPSRHRFVGRRPMAATARHQLVNQCQAIAKSHGAVIMEYFVSAWLTPSAKGGGMASSLLKSAHRFTPAHSAKAQCASSLPAGSHATVAAPNFALQRTPNHGVTLRQRQAGRR